MAKPRRLSVKIHAEAEQEAREAFLWYLERNPGAAERFQNEFEEVLAAVAEGPLLSAEVETGVRRAVFPRYPYALLYGVEAKRIIVLAVAHQRRRPGYWRGRRG